MTLDRYGILQKTRHISSNTITQRYNDSISVIMSKEYEGQDLRDIAAGAEKDLGSHQLKAGTKDTGFGGKSGKGGSLSSKSFPRCLRVPRPPCAVRTKC